MIIDVNIYLKISQYIIIYHNIWHILWWGRAFEPHRRRLTLEFFLRQSPGRVAVVKYRSSPARNQIPRVMLQFQKTRCNGHCQTLTHSAEDFNTISEEFCVPPVKYRFLGAHGERGQSVWIGSHTSTYNTITHTINTTPLSKIYIKDPKKPTIAM